MRRIGRPPASPRGHRRAGRALRRSAVRTAAGALALVTAVALLPTQALAAMPEPLTTTPGDAQRGRAIVASRQVGLCLLCHSAPIAEERFQGNLAPDLAGTGSRWTEAQLRARIVDSSRINSQTIMPAYFRADGLVRVGRAWVGRTVFDAQQVEDVVAYLKTLQ